MKHGYGGNAVGSAGSMPSDAELLAAVRAGDQTAYGQLWTRHAPAARRLARQVARPSDTEELVSESFYRVLRAIDGGGGPDGAFRPYLLSTLRRASTDVGRSYYQRITLTEDDNDLDVDHAPSAADTTLEQDEQSAAWRAWASLPEASRTLLWHLIIEEETPKQVAPLLGTSPNGVSSRAVRARERLRQAFLQQHIRAADSQQCAWTRERLGEYVRGALSQENLALVERHLDECEHCAAALAEVRDVNMTLRAVILPVALGGSLIATGYLATRHTGTATAVASMRRVSRRAWLKTGTAVAATAAASATILAVTGHPGASHNTQAADVRTVQSTGARPPASPRTSAPASLTPAPRRTSRPAPQLRSDPRPPLLRPPTATHVLTAGSNSTRPPSGVTPTPTPTPTQSTPTPTPSQSTPTPTPSSSAPTTSASTTPPRTAGKQVTRTVTGLDGTDATLDIAVSSGWAITGVAAPLDSACTVSDDASAVECAITDPGPGPHTYLLELVGPAQGSGVMHVRLDTVSGTHLVQDFPF
jgi:RNA polymerase sigma factor (sigma-70 family)